MVVSVQCLFLPLILVGLLRIGETHETEAGGRKPGLQARITVNGLNYANKVSMQALAEYIGKVTIPGQSGKSGKFKYDVTDMRVTSFNRPTSSLQLQPGRGLTWSGQNAGLTLHGDFKLKALFIKSHGSFDVNLSGLCFSITFTIGMDASGRPRISAGACSSDIGGLDIKFHGGASWFINLFKKIFAKKIKDTLKGKLCELIVKEINEDAAKKLATLPVLVTLDKVFKLDYRLTANPNFTQKYMETYHKGEIYWATDDKTEAPVPIPALPAETGTTQMFYVTISEYIFNTVGYVAQKNSFLKYNLTKNDLPAGQKGALNTTCNSMACLGNLIPQLGKMYPGSTVDLDLSSTVAPHMHINPTGINISCTGNINMFAHTPAGKRVYLLTLNASMWSSVEPSINNELMKAKIKDIGFHLDVLNSSVGTIHPYALQFVIDTALKIVLIPKLNDLGARGFPLPVTKEIKFVNTKLTLAQNAVVLATDLIFKPAESSDVQPSRTKTTTLRYQAKENVLPGYKYSKYNIAQKLNSILL